MPFDNGMNDRARNKPRRNLRLQAVIVMAAAALIALTWSFTATSIRSERQEAEAHAEANVANLALGVEWQINRQLQAINELMQLLVVQWQANPAGFDPTGWARRSLILGDGSMQVLVTDAAGSVSAASSPGARGLNLSERDFFRAQRDSRRAGLFVGPAIRWEETGQWEINLSRRLETKDGAFAGALVVAYDPWALINQLQQIDLGPRGLIALVGDDGAIRALVSPFEIRPGEPVGGSAMFRALNDTPQSVWTGPSAPDGVARIHAFRHLRDQDLTIVIGVDQAVALRDADTWAATARSFAFGVTIAVAGLAGLLLRTLVAGRFREERLARDRTALEAAYAEAETAKAQAEARSAQLEGVLSGMSDGVMLLDRDLKLALWNGHFAPLTGVPEVLLRVGTPVEALLRAQAEAGEFVGEDPDEAVGLRMRLLRESGDTGARQRDRPGGQSVERRRSALPGGGFVTLYSDVTARRQTEQARDEARRIAHEATEQKAGFVAVVSHEIRTPLNAVLGCLSLLDQSGLSPAQRRLAVTAHQAGDALLSLVNDILELSRMEAGQLELRAAPLDLPELLEGVAEIFRSDAAQRGITLRVMLAPGLPRRVVADAGRLRQVVMNFVSNATKFSAPGTVTIRAARTRANNAPALLLAVRDQGPPIPAREAAGLFRPFSRLASARNEAKPGTGLGLAICERLARLMQGQVGLGVSSEGGNEFWATVPLEVAPPMPRGQAAHAARSGRSRRSTVLLVEDVPANHLVTALILRRAGHRVEVAESGADAIRRVQAEPFDLVLMDLAMPEMGGEEAARCIRALPGAAGGVPIVALTATSAPEDHARCEAAGMDGVLAKPVAGAALLAAVESTVFRRGQIGDRPPQARAEALLDEARFAELRSSLAPAVFARLLDECAADMRRRLRLLRAAVQAADGAAVAAQAHALAGVAATYALSATERRMRRAMATAHDGAAVIRPVLEGAEAELERAVSRITLALQPPIAA